MHPAEIVVRYVQRHGGRAVVDGPIRYGGGAAWKVRTVVFPASSSLDDPRPRQKTPPIRVIRLGALCFGKCLSLPVF